MKKELTTKSLVLAALFIAKATPQCFFMFSLPVILRIRGFSLEIIGLLQLASIRFLIKFLWAPLMEIKGNRANHFNKWTRQTGFAYAAVLLAIGFLDLQNIYLTGALIMFAAFVSATQDIAIGALFIKLLDFEERSFGSGIKMAAVNISSLAGSGLVLIIYNHTSWLFVLCLMAGFLLVVLVLLPLLDEKKSALPPGHQKVSLLDWLTFFKKPGMLKWLVIMLAQSLGISAIHFMMRPFLVDLKFDPDLIAFLTGVFGMVVGAVTSLGAGLIKSFFEDRRRTLLIFTGLNMVSSAYFIFIAKGNTDLAHIYAAIALINIALTLSSVICTVLVMDFSRKEKEGIDYSIQMTAIHLGAMAMMAAGGFIVSAVGYTNFFILQTLIGVSLLVVTVFLFKGDWIPKPGKERSGLVVTQT